MTRCLHFEDSSVAREIQNDARELLHDIGDWRQNGRTYELACRRCRGIARLQFDGSLLYDDLQDPCGWEDRD